MKITYFLFIILSLIVSLTTIANDKFPLRKKYKELATISHQKLYTNLKKYKVIDVRSEYEFKTLHIKGALHIPISNQGFISSVEKIRDKTPLAIVFYCNGITCKKSYQAAQKAFTAKIKNCFVFDLGVLGWSDHHPDAAVLLGQNPVPRNMLISEKKFQKHNLGPINFIKKINDDSIIIDIREPFQRRNQRIRLSRFTRHMTLDKLEELHKFIKKSNKTLLIYDAVGKQVRWLQYYLESKSFKNYYFLNGGVHRYLEFKKMQKNNNI